MIGLRVGQAKVVGAAGCNVFRKGERVGKINQWVQLAAMYLGKAREWVFFAHVDGWEFICSAL